MRCPQCGSELDEDNYCSECMEFFNQDDEEDFSSFEEQDYESMINNGDEICLNCTFWSVSPYGASHGMICRKGYPTDGPGYSCSEFVQERNFDTYGNGGELQFDETSMDTSNKLYYWKNSR